MLRDRRNRGAASAGRAQAGTEDHSEQLEGTRTEKKREPWPGNRRGFGELNRRMNLAPKHEYVTKGEEPTCEDHQPGKRGKNESRERTRAIRPRDRKEEG